MPMKRLRAYYLICRDLRKRGYYRRAAVQTIGTFSGTVSLHLRYGSADEVAANVIEALKQTERGMFGEVFSKETLKQAKRDLTWHYVSVVWFVYGCL
jgi:hypothetical protein